MLPDINKQKYFFSISEAASLLGISINTLRRWDKKGVIASERMDGKNRYFTKEELHRIQSSKRLRISSAAEMLGLSVSRVRRLAALGFIKSVRNERKEREFTHSAIEAYKRSYGFKRKPHYSPQPFSSFQGMLEQTYHGEKSPFISMLSPLFGLLLFISLFYSANRSKYIEELYKGSSQTAVQIPTQQADVTSLAHTARNTYWSTSQGLSSNSSHDSNVIETPAQNTKLYVMGDLHITVNNPKEQDLLMKNPSFVEQSSLEPEQLRKKNVSFPAEFASSTLGVRTTQTDNALEEGRIHIATSQESQGIESILGKAFLSGFVVLKAGQSSIDVTTGPISAKSLVFTSSDQPVALGSQIKDETTITITADRPLKQDVRVNWWVLNP